MKSSQRFVLFCCFLLLICFPQLGIAEKSEWKSLNSKEEVSSFVSGLIVERVDEHGQTLRGEYRADGTGTVFSFGAPIERTWKVSEANELCINVGTDTKCYVLEKNISQSGLYRAKDSKTGVQAEFQVIEGPSSRSAQVQVKKESKPQKDGGAASVSADEIAKELSNPNTAVATLTFKNQFRWFKGDLPRADDQWNYSLLLQPSLPFVRDNGDKIIFRPALPVLFDQPVFQAMESDFGEETGIGDLGFDLVYAPTLEGYLLAVGVASSVPIATNNLGSDLWSLGPEIFFGKVTKNSVYGLFPNHQWDVTGSGDSQVNNTAVQAFYTHIAGGGWTYGSGPIMNHDWVDSQWTIPLQLNVGKTVIVSGRPWKLGVELNYYVEQPDAFGPEWLLSVNIAPVVKNHLASLIGMSKE